MVTKTIAIAVILIFTAGLADATGIVGQQQGQAQGQIQGQAQGQLQSQKAIGIGIGIGGQGGDGGAGGEANNEGVTQTLTTDNEMNVVNPRQLPGMPLPGQALMPSFVDDAQGPDFRVQPVADLIRELGPQCELEDLVRLSNSSVKISDGLVRETLIAKGPVTFTTVADPTLRLLGSVSGYSESDKLNTWNCFASAVTYAVKKGATHVMLVRDGFKRAGTFYGWHLGLGGGATGLMGDAGASAGGGAVSIGPGVTSAESAKIDRPYVVIKAYYKIPQPK